MLTFTIDGLEEPRASSSQPAVGWDPFEVWRTRVRAAPEESVPLSSDCAVVEESIE